MTIPKLRLALVRWNDAWSTNTDSITLDDVKLTHQPVIVSTLGWILLEDEKGVTIVNEIYDHTFRGRTFIPAAMVISVDDFQLTRKRVRSVGGHPSPSPTVDNNTKQSHAK